MSQQTIKRRLHPNTHFSALDVFVMRLLEVVILLSNITMESDFFFALKLLLRIIKRLLTWLQL